jgi:hypothetical protein
MKAHFCDTCTGPVTLIFLSIQDAQLIRPFQIFRETEDNPMLLKDLLEGVGYISND